jgi:surface antigen
MAVLKMNCPAREGQLMGSLAPGKFQQRHGACLQKDVKKKALFTEREEETRAFAYFGLSPDSATVFVDDAFYGSQTNARAFEVVIIV